MWILVKITSLPELEILWRVLQKGRRDNFQLKMVQFRVLGQFWVNSATHFSFLLRTASPKHLELATTLSTAMAAEAHGYFELSTMPKCLKFIWQNWEVTLDKKTLWNHWCGSFFSCKVAKGVNLVVLDIIVQEKQLWLPLVHSYKTIKTNKFLCSVILLSFRRSQRMDHYGKPLYAAEWCETE